MSVSLHMSVDGDSALALAVRWGEFAIVSLLVDAGGALDLQNTECEIEVLDLQYEVN